MSSMKTAAILLLLVLVLPTASARLQQVEFEVQFAAPAQLAGLLEFDRLQWIILVFADQASATMEANLEEVQAAWNHSSLNVHRPNYLVLGEANSTYPTTDLELEHSDRFRAGLSFGQGWASLVIQAESIAFNVPARTQLDSALSNTTMDSYLDLADFPDHTVRRKAHAVPGDQVVSTLYQISEQPFTIAAQGIRLMEWFNADLSCSRTCLPGGGAQRMGQVHPVTVETLSYITIHSGSGILHGAGHAMAVALGGDSIEVATEGYARLPAANLTGQCGPRSCPNPEGRTFRANGTMRFAEVHLSDAENGRMKAQFTGSIEAASFGEKTIFGFSRGAAWTAFGILTFLAVTKGLAALFTRHRRPALDNPRTRHIYELVCSQPGLSFSDLRKLAETGTGNLLRHVKKLVDERLVVARPYRNSHRYYENHGRYDQDWQQFAVLKDEDNRMLHDWLLARPGSTQSQVHAGAARGRSPSALRHALKALKAAGLITAHKDGRFVYYRAVPLASANTST
jgi:hypothetical protein